MSTTADAHPAADAPAGSGAPAVAVEDLVVRFGEVTAVDGITFSVARGEVFGLLGPNGAGKTTTLRVLTTLLPPGGGHAAVAGYDVRREGLFVRASIGYVPQALSADGALTAAENLDFYARVTAVPRRERPGRIADAIEAMELQPMLDRLARELSGGMLRRLEIATALLNEPAVLFLDEPTVGLDPGARAMVWERLHALRDRVGTTLVVTTHLMEEADRHCGRLAIIDHGRFVEEGPPADIRARHDHVSLEEVFTGVTGRQIAWPAGSAERPAALAGSPLSRVWLGATAMAQAELRKLRHDHLDLLTRSVQPLLWLFVFGTALRHTRALTLGSLDYRAYLAPGVMAQAALFIAIFFGLAVIWERDVGQLQRLLATPLPRTAIVLGKAVGASTRALVQSMLLLVVLAVAGIGVHWTVFGVVGALALLALGTASFACLSMLIAAGVRTRERFMGIGQLVMMPLFFASSALYPLAIMPGWLHVIARVNPLTYEVQGMRQMLVGVGGHGEVWLDFLVVLGFLAAMVAAATRAYPRAIL
jgi:daunorubicin resistance ABC transporter membrane protein